MKNTKTIDDSRRRFFISAGGALGAVALAGALPRSARADSLPDLSPTDATAAALHYTPDASKVDKGQAPTYVAGSACATCNFYQGGTAATGPCALFPGKAVNAKGWCAGYAKKA